MDENKNDSGKATKSLISLIPIYSLMILGFGVLNLTVFYSFFNFNVFPYLELNEIILETLKDFVIVLIPVIVLSLPYDHVLDNQLKNEYKFEESLLIVNSPEGWIEKTKSKRWYFEYFKKQKSFVKIRLYVYLSFTPLLIIFFLVMSKIHHRLKIDSFILVIIISIVNAVIILYSSWNSKKNQDSQLDVITRFTIKIGVILLIVAIIEGVVKEIYLKRNQNLGVNIELKDRKIISNKGYFYIGRTKGYVFFYNDTTQFTDVFPDKEILQLSIK